MHLYIILVVGYSKIFITYFDAFRIYTLKIEFLESLNK